ncbi:MAG: hypothetical protein ACP5O3_04050 [Candidatus Micrarchaeia archaeon]|jgi:hypothetical protein
MRCRGQGGPEYVLVAAFGVLAAVVVLALARQSIWPQAEHESNQSAASVREFLNSSANNSGGAPASLGVRLVSPPDGGSVSRGVVEFVFSPINFTSLFNATLYGDFNGSWAANESSSDVSFGLNSFFVELPAGGPFKWNVEVCDFSPSPACVFASANYSVNVT